jgi:hypothetical protein
METNISEQHCLKQTLVEDDRRMDRAMVEDKPPNGRENKSSTSDGCIDRDVV